MALKEITDRISPDEVEFHMVTLHFDSRLSRVEKIDNIMLYRIGFAKLNPSSTDLQMFPLHLNKYLFQFLAPVKAAFLHRTYHYDGIWAMMAHATGVPAGLFKTFYKNVFYVLTLQEGDPPEYIERKARPVWPLFKRGFTCADYLVGESTFLEKWGRRMGFKGESAVIPNGVDIEKFKVESSKLKVQLLRERLGIKKDEKVLVTTSRLVKKNAVGDIIEALTYLPETVKLLILGDGPLRETLELQVARYQLHDRVHFLGFIEGKEISLHLKVADIFVRPSLSEGMGNSFIEAMAAGIPVVGTAVGGIVDFLKDRETGFICEVQNPESIAEQVKYITDAKNKETVKRVVQNARILVEEKYNWDQIAVDMKNIFTKLS